MTCGIYKITSPSGKVYVGQSTNIEARFANYLRLTSCKRQRRLFNSFKAHGARSHVFEIVEQCGESELNERERFWQEALHATGKDGLNCRLTVSSDRSGRHSAESRAIMRERQGGANNPNYGKRGTETSTFGRKRPESERAAIRAYQSKRGRIIQQYDQFGNIVREARCRDFVADGYSQGNISSCCNGRLKTYKGFLFRYKPIEGTP